MQTVFSAIINTIRASVYLLLGFIDQVILKRKNLISILSYHSISSDNFRFSLDLAELKKQITYLKNNYEIITLEDLEKFLQGQKKITKPSVLLTFDDGYQDILTVKSLLTDLGIKPAIFVLSASQSANWSEIGPRRQFLTTKEIKSLVKSGWSVGCHSATHSNLAQVSRKQLKREISDAKKSLEKELGLRINYFAYPRGKYNKAVLQEVKHAKYMLGFTMDDGFISPKSDFLRLPRVGIDRTHSFAEFKVTFLPSVILFRKFVKSTFLGRFL
jgi:peptidoglycan/xylan/chitin deacetylase (PgdA/CDA1 family)